MLYDISPPVTTGMAVFPGDTPPSREVLLDMAKGDPLTLSTLRSTVHVGAHADGANHYGLNAPAIDQMPLEHYLGPCQVVEVKVKPGTRIGAADLRTGIDSLTAPRVLFKTGTFPDPATWTEDFAALEPQLVHALAERGVITVGIDTPSVDVAASKDLPAHQAFLATGLAILEGLVLRDVPPGSYELIALPLKLVGFDASPVRAVLRTFNDTGPNIRAPDRSE